MSGVNSESTSSEHAQQEVDNVNKNNLDHVTPANDEPQIIVDDLLCFVTNKMRTLPTDSIVQICTEFYDNDTIETSKKKLFELLPLGSLRLKFRTGEKKERKNLEDIIKKISECDTSDLELLWFVSKSLNLPPVSFESIDVTSLLTKMENMEAQMMILQRGLNKHVESSAGNLSITKNLQSTIDKLDNRLTAVENRSIPTQDCGQSIHFPPIITGHETTPKCIEDDVPRSTYSQTLVNTIVQEGFTTVCSPKKQQNIRKKQQSTAAAPNPIASNTRSKKPSRIGNASNTGIKAVKRPIRSANVYATRFDPEMTTADLEEYLMNRLNIATKCTKLNSRRPDIYSSFYIRAVCENPQVFMNPDIWPEDIYYRWYKPDKPKDKESEAKEVASNETDKDKDIKPTAVGQVNDGVAKDDDAVED